jgi:hypothetical protein
MGEVLDIREEVIRVGQYACCNLNIPAVPAFALF